MYIFSLVILAGLFRDVLGFIVSALAVLVIAFFIFAMLSLSVTGLLSLFGKEKAERPRWLDFTLTIKKEKE